VKKALQHPDLSSYEVLILYKYTQDKVIDQNKQKLMSKKKQKIKDAEGKENNTTAVKNHRARRANATPLANITVDTEASLVSDVTTTVNDECSQFSSSHTARTGSRATLTTAASPRKTSSFLQRKQLSSTGRRTPKQKQDFEKEKRIIYDIRSEAYGWAAREATENQKEPKSRHKSAAYCARQASARFDIEVKPYTVRLMLRDSSTDLHLPGPGMAIGSEAYAMVGHSVLSKAALTQLNGGAELKENEIIAMISNLVKGNARQRISIPWNLWRKIKAANAVVLELTKEQHVELRRQMWTTVCNLKLWYNSWEYFCIEYGFGIDDGTDHVKFTEEQRRRIANMDETKFSMDGADGGIGGRPANSITIANITRSGTRCNKASMRSTLVCGYDAAVEPLPVHVMFSSNAQEDNFVIDYRWIAAMPKIQGIFGHESVNEYCIALK
jgi:hypothetical protein